MQTVDGIGVFHGATDIGLIHNAGATTDGTAPASTWMADRSSAWDRRVSALEEQIRAKKP